MVGVEIEKDDQCFTVRSLRGDRWLEAKAKALIG